MTKQYDRAYFDRWYRNSKHERDSKSLLERKIHLAVSIAEYYLERPIRSVLDVGCGEAVWRAPLLKLRPKIEYRGVDSSGCRIKARIERIFRAVWRRRLSRALGAGRRYRRR